MFRIAVCDNERDELEQTVQAVTRSLQMNPEIEASVKRFSSSVELCQLLQEEDYESKSKGPFDLYFLVVQMPEVNGIELGYQIRKRDGHAGIIYTTYFREYAFDAYGVKAVDYLKKPIDEARLSESLVQVYREWERRQNNTITVNAKTGIRKLRIQNIMYVENVSRCAVYHLDNGECVSSVSNRGRFEDALMPLFENAQFVQPHKSFVVNLDYVKELMQEALVMEKDVKIPVSRNHRLAIKKAYLKHLNFPVIS